jgi:predicted RNase H-like HicB family nuclease
MSGVERALIVVAETAEIELDVVVRREEGMYWAEVPSHPGLFASGETMDELIEAIGEAWVLYSHGDSSAEATPAPTAAMQSMQILVPA